MTVIEKVLYIRIMYGLGLIEAVDRIKKTGNYFDGPWDEKLPTT